MPRNIERDKREADRRKNQLIEAGFRLFSQNGIETVSLQKVADAANVSPATMYKYFLTKEKLLIAISAKVWDEVWQEALGDPGTNHFEHFTAYQGIEFYADRMIALYKNRPEVLRFSGEYKTYIYNFEMHVSLFPRTYKELTEQYENVKEHLLPVDGTAYQFAFTPKDFYVFVLAHAHKHYSHSGTGIRTLADIYVMDSAERTVV